MDASHFDDNLPKCIEPKNWEESNFCPEGSSAQEVRGSYKGIGCKGECCI